MELREDVKSFRSLYAFRLPQSQGEFIEGGVISSVECFLSARDQGEFIEGGVISKVECFFKCGRSNILLAYSEQQKFSLTTS